MWGTTDHTQPDVVVSDATFPCCLTPFRKTKVSFDSFHRYWWAKNLAVWLDEQSTPNQK